jgi:hypothetical protein
MVIMACDGGGHGHDRLQNANNIMNDNINCLPTTILLIIQFGLAVGLLLEVEAEGGSLRVAAEIKIWVLEFVKCIHIIYNTVSPRFTGPRFTVSPDLPCIISFPQIFASRESLFRSPNPVVAKSDSHC